MEKYTVEQVLTALAELAEMLLHEYLVKKDILQFQEYLKQGLTLKEAQDKITESYAF